MMLRKLFEKTWPPFMSKEDRYYYHLFVKNKKWNSKGPNADEKLRWEVIEGYIRSLDQPAGGLRILDIGCGRGWMTNLLGGFGKAEGLEPVGAVVKYARRLFPSITFHHSTVGDFAGSAGKFDLITASEVIEHIPDSGKAGFISSLRTLLTPGGHVIISTPRKEILHTIP